MNHFAIRKIALLIFPGQKCMTKNWSGVVKGTLTALSQVRSHKIYSTSRSGQVRSGQVRSGQVRSGQVTRSGHFLFLFYISLFWVCGHLGLFSAVIFIEGCHWFQVLYLRYEVPIGILAQIKHKESDNDYTNNGASVKVSVSFLFTLTVKIHWYLSHRESRQR